MGQEVDSETRVLKISDLDRIPNKDVVINSYSAAQTGDLSSPLQVVLLSSATSTAVVRGLCFRCCIFYSLVKLI